MCRSFKYIFVLTAVFLTFVLTQNSFASNNSSAHLVSPDLLKAANLEIVWESSLPLKRNENMEEMIILGDHIYLVSNRNFAMSLNRKSGMKIFNRSLIES